jgi:predicted enzyme related to lactoylglutathione lyase
VFGTLHAAAGDELGFRKDVLLQLAVSDLDRALTFYCDTLGFELDHRVDDLQWAEVRSSVPGLMIGLGVQPQPKGSASLSVNLGVSDIEAARAILEARGVRFSGPTLTVPNVVRLAEFNDPDGNRIRLAQDMTPKP